MTRERNSKTISERDQRLPDFRLEEDDDRDTDIEESVTKNKLERCEILFDGEPVEKNEGGNSRGHGSGASSAKEFQDCIHQQKDKDNVRDIARFKNPS